MTRQEWDRECTKRISARLGDGRSHDAGMVMREVNAQMAEEFGPRPPRDDVSWMVKAGVGAALRVTVPDKGVRQMAQRIIVALMYAISVGMAAWQASGTPQTPEAWGGLAVAVIVAFWGKFSSSQTIIAVNRPPWTEAERAKAALDELNKGIK